MADGSNINDALIKLSLIFRLDKFKIKPNFSKFSFIPGHIIKHQNNSQTSKGLPRICLYAI